MAQTDLGKWMITNGGEYNPETTYEQLTIVTYNSSMFLTLKTVKGITPVNDNVNYNLMAQGTATTLLSSINATDTYGVLGSVGAQVSSQALVDYLTNEVINKLVAKTQIANDLTTQDSDKVLSALQGYNLQQSIETLNSNIEKRNAMYYRDDSNGFYGFATVGPNQFNPSMLINPDRNILQLRYTDTSGNEKLFDFALTRK